LGTVSDEAVKADRVIMEANISDAFEETQRGEGEIRELDLLVPVATIAFLLHGS
jgi:hypothetical protein